MIKHGVCHIVADSDFIAQCVRIRHGSATLKAKASAGDALGRKFVAYLKALEASEATGGPSEAIEGPTIIVRGSKAAEVIKELKDGGGNFKIVQA